MNNNLNEEALQDLYAWIDKIKLSRPKRNITRDFSDGVMTAEVVKHFFPKLVELHNYTPAHSTQQKLTNWTTLNRKVFSKINFHVPEDVMKKVALSTPGIIEPVLWALRERLEEKRIGVSNVTEDLEYYSAINNKPHTGPNVDPAFRLLLEEKEQALLALQETVEILQIKVNRLEHLVHLKDLRIEDLTRHLERYKARTNIV